MKELILSKTAKEDIANIDEYISEQLSNPKAANDLLISFRDAFDTVAAFPESCPLCETENAYRKLIVKNYIAFYKTDGNAVTVYRILYGMTDYQKHL